MDYVTIVSVDTSSPPQAKTSIKNGHKRELSDGSSIESQFITVLAINGELEDAGELLLINREGEKLGFGLKFYGGNSGSKESIKQLFIQSCAPNSPASRAVPSWGSLGEGDEILQINGIPVNTMSRLECVKKLKESDAHIKLFVRHGRGKIELPEKMLLGRSNSVNSGKPPTPPQAPPRKILKRNSSYPEPGTISYPRATATEEDLFNIPPPPEFYLNSLDDFGRGFDSDDTGSTISTVVDRFITDNTDQKEEELAKALKPFTMLEKEFNIHPEVVIKLEEAPQNKLNEQDIVKLEINSYENVKMVESPDKRNNYENVELRVTKSELNDYENIFDQVKPTKISVNIPPVPKPRQQQVPPVEPRKRTKFLNNQKNMYKNCDNSYGEDLFENTIHEYKTIENWLQETDDTEDTGTDGELLNDSFGDTLPRCVEFVPKDNSRESTIAVKQCIKVVSTGDELYNSSSDEEGPNNVYEPIAMENNLPAETLGPPGNINIPDPNEAYFNGFQWPNHALCLETIGEVEEELSSIEPQPGSTATVNTREGDHNPAAAGDKAREQLSGSASAGDDNRGKQRMSSTVIVSPAIKTDTTQRYLVSSNPAITTTSKLSVGCGDNEGKNGNTAATLSENRSAESARANGATLLDQSMEEAINLDEGRIRINNSSSDHGMSVRTPQIVKTSGEFNGMPPSDKTTLLSVTNIDAIRNVELFSSANVDCELGEWQCPPDPVSLVGVSRQKHLGIPQPEIVNRPPLVVSSTVLSSSLSTLDQNNNNTSTATGRCATVAATTGQQRQCAPLESSIQLNTRPTTAEKEISAEKLRDCVQGIDSGTTIITPINNGNHVGNQNNRSGTIEPQSVINGLHRRPETGSSVEIVVGANCRSNSSHNGVCDKEFISSALEVTTVSEVEDVNRKVLTPKKITNGVVEDKVTVNTATTIESEIAIQTEVTEFYQLERRIIFGGSVAKTTMETITDSSVDEKYSETITGTKNGNLVADNPQHLIFGDQRGPTAAIEESKAEMVNLLVGGDSDTEMGTTKNNLEGDLQQQQQRTTEKNQVPVKEMDPIIDSVTPEIVIAVGGVTEDAEQEVCGGGHVIGSDDAVDLTEVKQLPKSGDQSSVARPDQIGEKQKVETMMTQAETVEQEEVVQGKEMDRGSVSLVSKANNISNGTVTVNKSLSPGLLLMSPPTFSRLPPDGHEFPPNYAESQLSLSHKNSNGKSAVEQLQNSKVVDATMKISSRSVDEPPAPPKTAPPQSPRKSLHRPLSNGSGPTAAFVEMRRKSIETSSENGMGIMLKSSPVTPLGMSKLKGSEWRKDEKSEKSVRDKIAMFSKAPPSPPTSDTPSRKSWNRSTDDFLSAGVLDSAVYNCTPTSVPRERESMAKKARSVENLDDCLDGYAPSPPSYRTLPKDPFEEVNSYRPTFKKTYSMDVLNNPSMADESVYFKPLNDDFTAKYASLPRRMNLSTNSSITASNPQLTRTTSFSGSTTDGPHVVDRRRSSISSMLEQRKKSMSKLRGLIIPEKSAGFEVKLFDLPEIKSADLEKVPTNMNSMSRKPQAGERKTSNFITKEVPSPSRPVFHSSLSEPASTYQSIFETNRRNFGGPTQLGAKNGRLKDDKADQGTALPPTKPPRTSLIYNPQRSYLVDDSEDSDSIISLQSSRISTPPHSPVAPIVAVTVREKLPLTRTLSSETNTSIASSTASTLTSGTSGSQASCSSMGSTPTGPDPKRRIIKGVPQNEGSMNRKSVLASAKVRNGNAKNLLDEPVTTHGRFEDEDSTDGYDEEHQVFKRPKPKQRSSVSAQQPLQSGRANEGNGITNYKVVTDRDNVNDRVIKVATYVEVVDDIPPLQSATEKVIQMTAQLILSEKEDAAKQYGVTKTNTVEGSIKSSASESEPEMNDLVKWVRTEAAKSNTGISPGNGSGRMEKSISSSPSPVADRPIVPAKKMSTADIRKQFELKSNQGIGNAGGMKPGPISPPTKDKTNFHDRFSSWESVASNSSSGISSMPTRSIPSSETAQSTPTDFGSFTSIGSSHSLLTAQDLQAIIEEADPPLKTPDAFVIVLQRESPESSIGITLAGGADYEAKEITVHKVLTASPADKDGRLKKGDRILAINGLSMRGLTHRESVTVLKTPRSEVVLAVTRSPSATAPATKAKRPSMGSLSSLLERDCDETEMKKSIMGYHKASRSLDLDAMICDGDSVCSSELLDERSPCDGDLVVPASFKKITSLPAKAQEVEIFKDTCGLGFSIEGGFDSPLGNCPLTVKKVFMGGAAEKSGRIRSGNEIVAINGYTTTNMTRVSAWNYMKKLSLGPVRIVIL